MSEQQGMMVPSPRSVDRRRMTRCDDHNWFTFPNFPAAMAELPDGMGAANECLHAGGWHIYPEVARPLPDTA